MRMNKDGLFKIMQITDMQEIPKVSPDTMALLDAAIEDEKPDLVVYTGDQIKGYGVSYKGKGKELENAVAKTINTLLEPVTKRNIPFAVTFGNHDRQVGISNKDQFNDIYKALPNCIGTQAEGIDGGGTYNIPIKASDGSDRDAFNLYLFDSDSLLVMLASAGCHYVMSIPQSDDVMLMYQSTSYHDIAAIREMLGLSPIEEFKQWLEGYGIWENGHLGKNAGNPRIFL